MKVTKKEHAVIVPAPTYTLELTQDEARFLKHLVGYDRTIAAVVSDKVLLRGHDTLGFLGRLYDVLHAEGV